MIWKTARQRRAVMALLTKVRKRAKSVRIPPSRLSNLELDAIMSTSVAQKLIARLPAAHQKISKMERLEITDHFLGGMYDRHVGSWNPEGKGNKKNLLRLSRKPENFMQEVGYTDKPSHIPGGYWAYRSHSKKVMSKEAQKRHTLRNFKIGATKTFYHEYGHSVWSGLHDSYRRGIWESNGVLRAEWSTKAFPYRLDPAESFAESYTLYATSKASRNRLRKERPLSYDIMNSFFNHGESFASK